MLQFRRYADHHGSGSLLLEVEQLVVEGQEEGRIAHQGSLSSEVPILRDPIGDCYHYQGKYRNCRHWNENKVLAVEVQRSYMALEGRWKHLKQLFWERRAERHCLVLRECRHHWVPCCLAWYFLWAF